MSYPEGAIVAPFTEEQVRQLNEYQVCGCVHSFTCGNSECRQILVATVDGWMCPSCEYRQDWAWGFMALDKWGELSRAQREFSKRFLG